MMNRKTHIEQLVEMTLSDYPQMKDRDRMELHSKVKKEAYPESHKPMSMEDFIRKNHG